MISTIMKGVAPGQKVREQERDKTARMDGRELEASQHADIPQEGGSEERQQLQQQPKPRLLLKLLPKLQHEPKPKSAPTPSRRWETVQTRTQSQRAPIGPGGPSMADRCLLLKRHESVPLPGLAPTSGSSMAHRQLILRKDESIPLPRKMDNQIASAVDRALFQQQAPAYDQIVNTRRNAQCTMTAITHQNVTSEIALLNQDIINKVDRSVNKGIIDVEGN